MKSNMLATINFYFVTVGFCEVAKDEKLKTSEIPNTIHVT